MYEGFPKTINEQIAEYGPEITATFDIKVDNVIIAAASNVLDYMIFTYDGYKTRAPLYRLWSNYIILHGPDFSKAYAAWSENYNPLQNYDSKETNVYINNDGTETNTINHGKINTVAAGTGTNAPTTSNYVTTDDSTTARLESQSTQAGTTTDTESGSTTNTKTHTPTTLTIDSTEYQGDYVRGEIKEKAGNIGVTTSQQMLQSELDLRLNPLVLQYIDMFMRDYTYYINEEWCSYDC